MDARIVPSEHVLTMFYEVDEDVEVPEHRHGAQWGVVLAGSMDLEIDGVAATYGAGDDLLRPDGALHTAPTSAPATRASTSSPTPTVTSAWTRRERRPMTPAAAEAAAGLVATGLRARRPRPRQVLRPGSRPARRVVRGAQRRRARARRRQRRGQDDARQVPRPGIIRPDSGEIAIDGQTGRIDSPRDGPPAGDRDRSPGPRPDRHASTSPPTSSSTASGSPGGGRSRAFGWLRNRQMHRQAKEILDSPADQHPVGARPDRAPVGGPAPGGGRRPRGRLGPAHRPDGRAVGSARRRADAARARARRGPSASAASSSCFISHNMQQVLEVCTRAVVMRHGAVAADVAVADVTARDLVEFITGSRPRRDATWRHC